MRKYESIKKNNYIIAGLCSILVMMGIAYAAFASQLKISGTSTVTSNWDIEITGIDTYLPSEAGWSSTDGYNVTDPSYTATTATFSAGLTSPGDAINYIVEVTNKGTIDGQVTIGSLSCGDNSAIYCYSSSFSSNPKEDNFSSYVFNFDSGSNDYTDIEFTLKTGEKHYIVIQVGYDSSVTSQPDNLTADIKLTLDYEQYVDSSIPVLSGETTLIGGQNVDIWKQSSDGLYKDTYESGRYVYKGSNPNNYIQVQETDSTTALYRIIAKESDGTLKVIRNESIGGMAFDSGGRRYDSTGATYCNSNDGCNVWGSSSTMLDSNGNNITSMPRKIGGTEYTLPDTEAEVNIYLNTTWYETLNDNLKNLITTHLWNVGLLKYEQNQKITTDIQQEQSYKWNGKIGLTNPTDIVKTSKNKSCIGIYSAIENDCSEGWLEKISWHMNPFSSASSYVWYKYFNYMTKYREDVYPVFYLSSSITFEDGTDGSSSNPYKIVS